MKKIVFNFVVAFTLLSGAACAGTKSAPTVPTSAPVEVSTTAPQEPANSKGNVLEIMSWWTGGGEAEALDALITGFEAENPGVTIENAAIAGGGGTNAQAVLATRMEGGDPPSLFQANGGFDSTQWAMAGKIQPVDDIIQKYNLADVFPKDILAMNTYNGHVYGLPVNIGRNNLMWYNKQLLEKNNLAVPTTWDEFFTVAESLKDAGITPLALGDKNPTWATLVFENILLDKLGVDDYELFWRRKVSASDPRVREAAELFSRVLDYVNENHNAMDWQEAAQMLVDGKAAMLMMGDWAAGFFVSVGMKPNVDFGWIGSPGTSNVFRAEYDAFLIPVDAKNTDLAKAFIAYTTTPDAQIAFNQHKGSIPARIGIDPSKFNEYTQSAMKDFATLRVTGALMGKSVAPAGYLKKFNEAITMFVTQRDVDQLIKNLQNIENLLVE